MIPVAAAASRFACPPDCGWCCTHLERTQGPEEAEATEDFRALLREMGVHHCLDGAATGLSLSNAEAAALRAHAAARGMRLDLHPRTFILETRRRLAIVLDWHMPDTRCPFYEDYKCTAYEARPLVCRAYPVLAPAPAWKLAPECPRSAPTLEARAAGALRLGAFLGSENRARRAAEVANAALDALAWRVLDAPGARFAKGGDAREAHARASRYAHVTPEQFLGE